MKSNLKQYARKIVNITFSELDGCSEECSIVGVFLFAKDSFGVFTGLPMNSYCGRSSYHNDIISLTNDLIPYKLIVKVHDYTSKGQEMDRWLLHAWPERYNKIQDYLKANFYHGASLKLDFDVDDFTKSHYPDKCPHCGEAAYIGLFSVDCTNCGVK